MFHLIQSIIDMGSEKPSYQSVKNPFKTNISVCAYEEVERSISNFMLTSAPPVLIKLYVCSPQRHLSFRWSVFTIQSWFYKWSTKLNESVFTWMLYIKMLYTGSLQRWNSSKKMKDMYSMVKKWTWLSLGRGQNYLLFVFLNFSYNNNSKYLWSICCVPGMYKCLRCVLSHTLMCMRVSWGSC